MADGHGEIALEVQQECRGTHLAAGGSCGACAGEEDPNPAVEIAALHAITGLADTAVAWLRRANMLGWKDYRLLAQDPFFAALRSDGRFQAVITEMDSAVAVMRRRTASSGPSGWSSSH